MILMTTEGEELVFKKLCSITNKQYEVRCKSVDWEAWKAGKLIQNAFPYLDVDQREFLKIGWTPAEWDAKLGSEEEE